MKYDDVLQLFKALSTSVRSSVPLDEWLGMPVHVDPTVPDGVIELRDSQGKVVKVYEWPKE